MTGNSNYVAELQFGAPKIDEEAFVAPTAVVVGAVTLGSRTSIWYGAVARADEEVIVIGPDSNVQDGCTLHSDPGFPLTVGRGVTVGHRVVLHGARVDDDVLVGMGSVVMNGAHIGAGSIVAAGAVVTQNTEVPPGSVVAGIPAKVVRRRTDEDLAHIRKQRGELHRAAARRAEGPAGHPPAAAPERRVLRRRHALSASVLLPTADGRAEEGERVEPPVHHPLLQRDDPVVGEVDALRAHLAAALGDVAVAQPEVVLRGVAPVGDVERVHVQLGEPDQEARARRRLPCCPRGRG